MAFCVVWFSCSPRLELIDCVGGLVGGSSPHLCYQARIVPLKIYIYIFKKYKKNTYIKQYTRENQIRLTTIEIRTLNLIKKQKTIGGMSSALNSIEIPSILRYVPQDDSIG